MTSVNNNSHVGLTTGAIVGTLGAAMNIYSGVVANTANNMRTPFVDSFKREASEAEKKAINESEKIIGDTLRRYKKYSFIIAGAALLTSLGCGFIVDKLRNNGAKEADEHIKQYGQEAWKINPKIAVSEQGLPYYKSNNGLKWGALLGAGCGILSGVLSVKRLPIPVGGPIAVLANTLSFALGGLGLGALTDSITNSNAKKNALKNMMQA